MFPFNEIFYFQEKNNKYDHFQHLFWKLETLHNRSWWIYYIHIWFSCSTYNTRVKTLITHKDENVFFILLFKGFILFWVLYSSINSFFFGSETIKIVVYKLIVYIFIISAWVFMTCNCSMFLEKKVAYIRTIYSSNVQNTQIISLFVVSILNLLLALIC